MDNEITIRLAGVVEESVVDGKGIRFTIFVQGCPHNCKGCHNPHTHDKKGGKDYSITALINQIMRNPLLQGVTFSGGEPFLYPSELSFIAKTVKANGLDVWCYSGYTYEELLSSATENEQTAELLGLIDVLIDGRFDINSKDLTLKFRGSSNQRIIDLKSMRERERDNHLDDAITNIILLDV